MDWKRWLKFSPYKKIWFWAGRPFTYIWRDIYHESEWLVSTLWFWMGALASCGIIKLLLLIFPGKLTVDLVISCILIICGIGWAIYTFGYIRGHIHWGKDWQKGQGK